MTFPAESGRLQNWIKDELFYIISNSEAIFPTQENDRIKVEDENFFNW